MAVPLLLIVLLVWFAVHQADDPSRRRALIDLSQLFCAMAAATMAGRRAHAATGRQRQHFALLAAAALCWTAGQASLVVYETVRSRPLPLSSVVDVGFLLAYLLFITSLIQLPDSRSSRQSRLRGSVDWLLVAAALLFVSWALGLGQLFHSLDPSSLSDALAIAYPVADLLLLAVALSALVSADKSWRVPLGLAILGIGSITVGAVGFAYLTANGGYEVGSWVDFGGTAGWLLITAYVARAPGSAQTSTRRTNQTIGAAPLVVPFVASALALVGVYRQLAGDPYANDPVLFWLALGVFMLTAFRSVAARLEADARALQLSAKSSELATLMNYHSLALEAVSMGTFQWDAELDQVQLSVELERLIGQSLGVAQSLAKTLAVVHPDDFNRLADTARTAIESGNPFEVEFRIMRPDGTPMWLQYRGRVITDEHGIVTEAVGVVADITDRVVVDERLAMRIRQGQGLADLGKRALSATTIEHVFDDATATVTEILGVEMSGVLRDDPDDGIMRLVAGCGWRAGVVGVATVLPGRGSQAGFTLASDQAVLADDLSAESRFGVPPHLRDHGARSGVTTAIRTTTGPWGVLTAHTSRQRTFTSDDAYFLNAVANIVGAAIGRARTEEELRHRSLHDSLTGLPNRALLLSSLEIGIAGARRSGRQLVLVHVSLDRFTFINESFGYANGDKVLVDVAQRLTTMCRPGDSAASLGGDEFVLLLADSMIAARDTAATVLAAVSQPILVGDSREEIYLSASIGVVTSRGGGDGESLLRDAAIAADIASKSGGNRYQLFDDRHRERSFEQARTETEFRHGLAEGQIKAYYQPIVRVDDGAIVGFEALARWQHPTRGVLEPAHFLDTCETVGLAKVLGEVMLSQVARQASIWNSARATPLKVSVNVSPSQLDHELVGTLQTVLESTGASADSLCIEVIETALNDAGQAQRVLSDIQQLGSLSVHIDDFGTGHSSLSRLTSLPIDGVKIDRSFITHLAHNASDRAIAAAIIGMAHAIGLEVIAEGVETKAQFDILRDMNCDLAQGWLFAPAMPALDCDGLVASAQTAYSHITSPLLLALAHS